MTARDSMVKKNETRGRRTPPPVKPRRLSPAELRDLRADKQRVSDIVRARLAARQKEK